MFSKMTEMSTQSCTHYSSKRGFEYESRIDRIFWSMPPWATRQINSVQPRFSSPFDLHADGLSGHSPVGFVASPTGQMHPSLRPIPSFITRHTFYRRRVHELEKQHNVSYNSLKWKTATRHVATSCLKHSK